jgi:acyl-CoA synthetase (AMP-forming)/AMP-acid ligase II
MNIATLLQHQANVRGQAMAMIDTYKGHQRMTSFWDFEQHTAKMAHFLSKAGLSSGQAVLIFQPMSLELYVVLGALFRLGLVAVFIDPSAGLHHLNRCCELYQVNALIATRKAHLLRLVSPQLRRIPLKFSWGLTLPWTRPLVHYQKETPLREVMQLEPQAPALMTFTSGSTSNPKAAVRTHSFLLAQHQALAHSLELKPGDIDVSTLPIFVLANLASGMCSLIPRANLRAPGKIRPGPVFKQINALGATRLSASPAFVARLADYKNATGETLNRLERIYTGGAPVFPQALESFQLLAPNAKVYAVYGSTEAEPIAHVAWHNMSPQDIEDMKQGQGLLVGDISPDIHLQIIENRWGTPLGNMTEQTFKDLNCSIGQVGEIVVSGNHVLSGYLHGQGDQESKFRVLDRLWHRTGDLGYIDHQQRLWLLGRCAALIKDHKGILYPFAVECAAQQFKGIRRSAVLSHQEKRLLLVEPLPRHHLDLEEIKQKLAWAALDQVVKMTLPVDKRHNAKIDYPSLIKKLNRR